jgi:hypothetical protein
VNDPDDADGEIVTDHDEQSQVLLQFLVEAWAREA